MGQAQQTRSGRWQAIARVDGRRKAVGSYDTKWEAVLAFQDFEQAQHATAADQPDPLDSKALPAPLADPTSLAACAVDWLERNRGALAVSTISSYRGYTRFLATDPLGAQPLSTITADDLRRAITRWKDAGAGNATISARFRVVRAVLIDAGVEVTRKVKRPPVPEDTGVYLKPAQEAALLASAARLDPRWHAFTLVGFDAGLRWAEVAALTPAVVDLDERLLTVRQVVEKGRIRPYTKGKKPRYVPITDTLAKALRPLVAAARLRAGADDPIFITTATGKVLEYHNWRATWSTIRGNAEGMRSSGATFHDTRTTFGSKLAAKGVPEAEIGAALGHAPGSHATQRYIRLAGRTTTNAW